MQLDKSYKIADKPNMVGNDLNNNKLKYFNYLIFSAKLIKAQKKNHYKTYLDDKRGWQPKMQGPAKNKIIMTVVIGISIP